MARILITSGPTRQYVDPVRYLTNASSGRMGAALAQAVLDAGHKATVVTGPVDVAYPAGAEVISVVSTEDMLEACLAVFPTCDGLIAAAAPSDYRPMKIADQKIRKTGEALLLNLVETPDVVALLGAIRERQWMVGFALETEDQRMRALQKLERKNCDLIVVNGPAAIHAADTSVEVLDKMGKVVAAWAGSKVSVARELVQLVAGRFLRPDAPPPASVKTP